MTTAAGTFEVLTGGEEAYHEADGDVRLTRARGSQRFGGGIEGDGSIEWLMCYLPTGGARMVGHQRIVGSVDGRRGSFLIEAVGEHDGKASTATWRIIDGSGTGELDGIRGQGAFEAPGGKIVTYRLEYDLG
jgi:hypothetical protein